MWWRNMVENIVPCVWSWSANIHNIPIPPCLKKGERLVRLIFQFSTLKYRPSDNDAIKSYSMRNDISNEPVVLVENIRDVVNWNAHFRGTCRPNFPTKLPLDKQSVEAKTRIGGDVRNNEGKVLRDEDYYSFQEKKRRILHVLLEEIRTTFFYLKSIICPTGKLHGTILLIEREIFNINLTGWLENGCAQPCQVPISIDDNVGT